jgi:hypothetical protein
MTYIRHRARMVQESVFEDLRNTLIACRWMTGTTDRVVRNPDTGTVATITVTSDQVYKLAEGHPIVLLDYFPETEGERQGPTELNTFAMDSGRPGDASPVELGSNAMEQPYLFNFAFYAVSDAVAEAVFSDLNDRYNGRIVAGEAIELYNYLDTSTTSPVLRMEVESFRYTRDLEQTAPSEVHLYFAELTITDLIDEA